ncbi:Asp-tRNA(Asn)/Glu-tRNA(Gln) amidotransferase subunit GatA [bacterium]|nr:Asp-tRNA(Asn)/Glu-tRNA(Gln) amidotransferase subunit GatA [bacterium]
MSKTGLDLSACQLADAIRDGELRAADVCGTFLEHIREQDPKLQAFVTVLEDDAMRQAESVDRDHSHAGAALLRGVPIALKDNLCTRGVPTTCSSKILEGFVPPYDATVVARLRGVTPFLGKTNLDEFAMGSSTENSALFETRNPHDPGCVPGGSSGGSAAAVASGMAPLALGSDTGGSIRQPAAFCGVVGLKPTYGRVSRYGLIAFASSLDQIGPFARTAEDAALLLDAIAGPDPRDATCLATAAPSCRAALSKPFEKLRVGLPREYFQEGLSAPVAQALAATRQSLQDLGCSMVDVSLPHTDYAVPTYYILAPAEASSNLARYDGVQYGLRAPAGNLIEQYLNTRSAGFGREVKRRIMLGTYALSSGYYDAYYLKALKVRRLIHDDFSKAFAQADVLLTPTTPTAAFRFGEKVSDPLQMYLSDIFTISANLAGLPALSFPCGMDGHLPIGAQLIGPALSEARLLRIVHEYQKDTNWHLRRPQSILRSPQKRKRTPGEAG